MILNKYNKIMERLTVSDQMKDRLTEGVDGSDQKKARIVRLKTVRRYASIAACFVLLIVGALIIMNLTGNDPAPVGGETAGPGDQTPWGSVVCENAADLSSAAGVKIADLEKLPFKPTETVYQKYANGIAEILYLNDADKLGYRVSKGDEDNSGDYNDYGKEFQKEINGTVCTLKGEGNLIFCVLYKRGDCSYSITSTAGLTLKQVENILN